MPVTQTSFDNIKVGYISETDGYVQNISIADANAYAELNPDTEFIFIDGDEKVRFLTINEGVKVHKKECPNALSLQSNFAYRIISSKWVDSSSNEYNALLRLSGIDNMGIVSNVTQLISNEMNVNIDKISFDSDDGIFTGLIRESLKNQTILNRLVSKLLKLKGVVI